MDSMPRKHRFPVNWPLQYRRVDESEWRRGRIINMSISGVLFEAAEPLSADEAVELSIMFQAPGRQISSSVVSTSGYVVRTESKIPAVIAVKFASAT
jgi:PilZ domain-containing protein